MPGAYAIASSENVYSSVNHARAILQAILTSTRIFPLCRPQFRLSGSGLRTWRSDERSIARETDAHLVQAPPVAHNEIVLFDQPQSGRQRLEAAVPEDRTAEKSITGKRTSGGALTDV